MPRPPPVTRAALSLSSRSTGLLVSRVDAHAYQADDVIDLSLAIRTAGVAEHPGTKSRGHRCADTVDRMGLRGLDRTYKELLGWICPRSSASMTTSSNRRTSGSGGCPPSTATAARRWCGAASNGST